MDPKTFSMQIIAYTLVVLLVSNMAFGLHCFQCNSKDNADCKEYFDHAHRDQLTVEPTECGVDSAEYCIKTTGVWGATVGTTRFCSSRDMGNQCQFVTYPHHDRIYRACIYTCKGNGCNNARGLTTSVFTVVALTTLALYTICKR